MTSRLLTLRETADRLRISEATLRRWRKANVIEGIQMGRDWKFSEAEIEAVIESKTVKK